MYGSTSDFMTAEAHSCLGFCLVTVHPAAMGGRAGNTGETQKG